jgi:hypothetical protein
MFGEGGFGLFEASHIHVAGKHALSVGVTMQSTDLVIEDQTHVKICLLMRCVILGLRVG